MIAEASPRRRRRYAIGVGLVLVVGYLGFAFMPRQTIRPMPIPSVNGYDDIVRAGKLVSLMPPKLVTGTSVKPQGAEDWGSVRQDLDANLEALAMLRLGLGRECVVPIELKPGYHAATNGRRASFRQLAEVLLWEARLAIREGGPADAARAYLDVVRLGRGVARGGIEVDLWVGNHIEDGGLIGLGLVRDSLDPAECSRTIADLRDIDAAREPYATIDARSTAQIDAEPGSFQRSVNRTYDRFVLHGKAVFDADRVRRCDETLALSRMVQVELALRVCRVESGSEPATLAGLVPKYLPSVPLDPFSGRPPIYRKTADGHVLYCLGANGVDDGGIPPVRVLFVTPTGDLFINSVESPHMP